MGWRPWQCYNINITKSGPHSQCDPHQNPRGTFRRNTETHLKIQTDLQGIRASPNSLERQGLSWRTHASCFQNLLQRYSHPDSVVPHSDGRRDQCSGTERPAWASACAGTWFLTGRQDHSLGKEESFQQIALGQLDVHTQRTKQNPRLTAYTKTNSEWIWT